MSKKKKVSRKLYSYALALIAEKKEDSRAHSGFVTSHNEKNALQAATAHGRELYKKSDFVFMHTSVNELLHTMGDIDWDSIVLFDENAE